MDRKRYPSSVDRRWLIAVVVVFHYIESYNKVTAYASLHLNESQSGFGVVTVSIPTNYAAYFAGSQLADYPGFLRWA
jgi:hypothetical protein